MKIADAESKNMLKHRVAAESPGPSPSPDGRMEAIAGGVRARLEESTGFSRRITSETIEIAQAMGVAEREIEKWLNRRKEQLASAEARIRSLKDRVNVSGIKRI